MGHVHCMWLIFIDEFTKKTPRCNQNVNYVLRPRPFDTTTQPPLPAPLLLWAPPLISATHVHSRRSRAHHAPKPSHSNSGCRHTLHFTPLTVNSTAAVLRQCPPSTPERISRLTSWSRFSLTMSLIFTKSPPPMVSFPFLASVHSSPVRIIGQLPYQS